MLKIIKTMLSGWKPHNIFYSECFVQNPFAIPDTGFYIKHVYTKLGKWFNGAPDIALAATIFWYIPAWCVCGV